MAKAIPASSKKKAAPKKKAATKSSAKKAAKKKVLPKKKSEETEPLSNFQQAKTGRGELVAEAQVKKIGETLLSVKLIKGETLEVVMQIVEQDRTITGDSKKFTRPVHPDLKAAFASFRVHLGLLCGYVSTKQLKDIDAYNIDIIETFTVFGVHISTKPGKEGVVISGQKKLESDKRVTLNTPHTLFEEKEETRYKYMEHLQKCLEILEDEVKQYVEGTKVGDIPQPELPFPDAGEKEEDDNQADLEFPDNDFTEVTDEDQS